MSEVHARLRAVRGRFALDVSFVCPARGLTGIFGPSGAGKTTILRCIAGLERIEDGYVRCGNEIWQDEDSKAFVPAHRRGVGYVFQEADLFTHLTVRGNLEYAARRAPDRRVGPDAVIEWLGLAWLLGRTTERLSGGERQRVAVARALLSSPRVLLMDEPLSALDEVNRAEILPYLQSLPSHLDVPILYVSHSLSEIGRLADHLIWLVDGRIRAAGPPTAVIGRLDFAEWRREDASVVVDARVEEHDDEGHLTRLAGPWGAVWVRRQQREPGERVRLLIRASDVSISLAPEPESTIMNQFRVRIVETRDVAPGEVLVRMTECEASDTADDSTDPEPSLLARITWRSRQRLRLENGREVFARVKSVALLE
jgi:molybdate transport system ATP-binding protein